MSSNNNGGLRTGIYVLFMVLTLGIALYAAVRGPATEAKIEAALNEHSKTSHPINRELYYSRAEGEVLKTELRALQEKVDRILAQQDEILRELRDNR